MLTPGRKFSSESGYRYGFNGKELDKEVSGTTTYDYGFRIYSSGLGRFLSVDPLTHDYPDLTSYQFASNTPISGIDRDGLEFVNLANGKVDYQLNPSTISFYQNNNDFKPWSDLISFSPKNNVLKEANKRRFFNNSIQKIQNAAGTELNLDYYSVTIHKLPVGWENTKDVLSEIRKNFDNYVNTESMKFKSDDLKESKIWNSDAPTSAVMTFDQDIFYGRYTEGASVLTSSNTDSYWTFSTIYTPFDHGDHPVSGTRQFGLTTNADGTYTFFVRGADRLSSGLDVMGDLLGGGKVMWEGADKIWSGLVQNVANFINQNGGSATINPEVSKRIDWFNDYRLKETNSNSTGTGDSNSQNR